MKDDWMKGLTMEGLIEAQKGLPEERVDVGDGLTIDIAIHKRAGFTVLSKEYVDERNAINNDLKALKDLTPDERDKRGRELNERVKGLKDLEL